ncbi:MFS transporter [Agrococcus sp. 1P02AA]|uniref:MFS transporter n=1 Tax=Agrococcus sp. 1P02AA TaxID=3132259 RepID=UPI0039A54ADE
MRGAVAAGMALIAATYGLARFGYGLFLPQLSAAFTLSPAVAGLVQAGSFLSYCCAAALAAGIARRPRWGVAAAGASAAAGAAGIALAQSPLALAASVILAGAGAGFASPALVALVQRASAAEHEERAQTTVNAGTGVGIVAAALLLVLAGEQWRAAWGAVALLATAAAVAVLLADRRSVAAPPAEREPREGARLRPLVAPIIAALLAGASSAAIWTFGSTLLTDAAPLGPSTPVLAWAILGASGAAGAWAARLVQAWSLRAAWATTSLTMVAATLALGLVPGLAPHAGALAGAATLLGAAAFGAGYTALSGVLIVWATRLDPARAAQGTVVLFVALAVGQSSGAAAIGALLEPLTAAAAFAVAGALGVAAVLPVLRSAGAAGSTTPRPRRS